MVARLQASPHSLDGTVAYYAAGACNKLGKPMSGLARTELFASSPREWFATWHHIRKRVEGIPRQIGLIFLDRVRKFRGWPRPTLSLCVSMPWLPASGARGALKDMLTKLVLETRSEGHVMLIPALHDLKLAVTQVPIVTMASVLRNAPSYYKKLGDATPWKCICHRFPQLPRLPCQDGHMHIFAPQDSWPWPPDLESMRRMPSHTSAIPSVPLLTRKCRAALDAITSRLGVPLREPVAQSMAVETAMNMYTASLAYSGVDVSVHHADFDLARNLVRGLVVEEFQKTRHMLVAECPRRVQLLCHELFEVHSRGKTFEYHADLPSELVLPLLAHIPGLSSSLSPYVVSKSALWKMPCASAPNKSTDKPDSRRPLIDRSRCPTAALDTPASRAVDWLSSVFLPRHLHIDLSRTDDFLPLVRDFDRRPPHGRIHSSGADLVSCFTNMPHSLVRSAWLFVRQCIGPRFSSLAAPRRGRVGTCRISNEASGIRGAFLVLTLADIEILLEHELACGWFMLGGLVGRQVEGLPMGSSWGGALKRLALIYCDVSFYTSIHSPPLYGHWVHAGALGVSGSLVWRCWCLRLDTLTITICCGRGHLVCRQKLHAPSTVSYAIGSSSVTPCP